METVNTNTAAKIARQPLYIVYLKDFNVIGGKAEIMVAKEFIFCSNI